ncbi:hypothetical protein BSKO_09124 [Bryopsis sp. KO-2023]|nr:hypothetical protein BSKO_09124 [Bryopsis sp. KO-2023]
MQGVSYGRLDLGLSRGPVWRRQSTRFSPFSTNPWDAKGLSNHIKAKNGGRTKIPAVNESSSTPDRAGANFQKQQEEVSRPNNPQRSQPTSYQWEFIRRISEVEKQTSSSTDIGGLQKKQGPELRNTGEFNETSAASTTVLAPWDEFTEQEMGEKRDQVDEKSEVVKKSEEGGTEASEEIPVPPFSEMEFKQDSGKGEQTTPPSPSPSAISNPTTIPPPSISETTPSSSFPTSTPPNPTPTSPELSQGSQNTMPPPESTQRPSSMSSFSKSWGPARRSRREDGEDLDDDLVAERKTMLLEALSEKGVEIDEISKGTVRMMCPECEGGSSAEESFSITVLPDYTSALYNCFRAKCGFQGGVHFQNKIKKAEKFPGFAHSEEMPVKPDPSLVPLDKECLEFFKKRGISQETLIRNGIGMEVRNGVRHIAFPYMRNGDLVNVKYRTLDKKFTQIKGAEKILYGLDYIKGKEEFIIVEGEMDKLALNEVGIWNVVSIPDGAPNPSSVKKKLPDPDEDKKFSFLWNCRDVFEDAKKIIFAVDNDGPGEALQAELTRRIGTFRCWVVDFPTCYDDSIKPKECSEEEMADDDAWFRKDANEVLMKDGAKVLLKYIESCRPYPIVGLSRFIDHADDLVAYYNSELDKHTGLSTGWPSLDAFYKVVPGELSIVTGVPNSGKSEFLDALAVNLAQTTDCAIAFCSMEKHVHEHGRQLAEKFIGKPFFTGLKYTQGQNRLNEEELKKAILWIDAHFPLILSKKDELPNMDWVLDMARMSIFRYGIKGLVIDPYNELDHQRPKHMSETEYVSQMLAKVKRFAQTYGVHVWFVAHPRQMHNWAGEPPNLYDISGSAHFVNKADAGIVVHRNWSHGDDKKEKKEKKWGDGHDDEDETNAGIYSKEDPQLLVRILIRKMRNKTAGTVGECTLKYDPATGRYVDLAAIADA